MMDPQRAAAEQCDPGEKPGTIRIRLLGGFRVSVGSRTIQENEWRRRRKAAAVIKVLALSPHRRLHRERVMDLLWPELETEAAANNLHRTLHFARRILESATSSECLSFRDEQLHLCLSRPLWVDVEEFESAVATARRARKPAAYRAAIDLYAGELLPEDRHQDWTESRRDDVREMYFVLLVEMAGLYEESKEFDLAIKALDRVVALDPTREEAHIGLMRVHATAGQSHKAILQYKQLHKALSRELDSEPGAQSRRLYEEIRTGRFPTADPSADGPEYPSPLLHNVPVAQSSFVGREREKLEVKRVLSMTGLLTLTGPGGCGKTRLALEVARDLVGAYPDGAWLVELAPLSEEALVPSAVAGALGVREQPGRPLADTLADYISSKRMLLILDNCEHLIYATARLVDTLLSSCEHLRILATSREALGIAGEANWLVPSLTVPDAEHLSDTQSLARYEAVQLFVERARSRLATFELTPENSPAVVTVCRRLDGIPLAIELATARMGALAVEQIAGRLEDSLGLLTTGSRTAAPRQQTLKAALAWSYDLLSEPEQELFGRLSVFAGGWTLEAAEAVGAGGGIEEERRVSNPPVLDLLSRLVDKSLVVAETSGEGMPRYRLLETVRQYASGKLAAMEEEESVRQRHALFFLDLAERAEPELSGTEQVEWLDRLESELSNLRVTLGWFRESAQGLAHLQLAGSLWRFCYLRGYYEEGRGWLEGALATGDSAPSPTRAKAYLGAGALTFRRCEYERGREQLEEAAALYRTLEDDRGVASASHMLGSIAGERGDYARAEALHEESLALWRKLGDEAGEAQALNYLGYLAWLQEKHERTKELCEETLVRSRRLGDNEIIAWALINLGSSALYAGDRLRARTLLGESLALSREVGFKEGVPWSLNQLGVLAYREGDHRWATNLLRESLKIHQDLGDRWRTASVLEALAATQCAQRRLESAACLFGAAQAVREAISVPVPLCERADHEESISAARAGLGEAAFEAAFHEGQAMSPDQAIEYALSADEPAAAPVPEKSPPPSLSRRQREVALLIARGLTNRQIAGELTISERTVTTHVDHILNKLGATSRTQVAAWMVEQRLLPAEVGPN